MHYVKSLAIAVVVLFASLLAISEQQPYAQGRFAREPGRTFDEEDLAPDSRSIAPEDESANDSGDEERPDSTIADEEQFPDRDSQTRSPMPSMEESPSHSSDHDAASGKDSTDESPEESPIVTSGPPTLPEANSLLPQEQVALSFVTLGVEAMGTEDLARARALFERAIEIAPLQPYSYFFLGRLALTREEHQKALPLLRKAEILLTRGDQAWRSEAVSVQGAVYEDLGELPQARKAYRKSLRFFPQNLRAMSALARLAGEEPHSDDVVPQ